MDRAEAGEGRAEALVLRLRWVRPSAATHTSHLAIEKLLPNLELGRLHLLDGLPVAAVVGDERLDNVHLKAAVVTGVLLARQVAWPLNVLAAFQHGDGARVVLEDGRHGFEARLGRRRREGDGRLGRREADVGVAAGDLAPRRDGVVILVRAEQCDLWGGGEDHEGQWGATDGDAY